MNWKGNEMIEKAYQNFINFQYLNLIYLTIALIVLYQFIKFFVIRKIDSSQHTTDDEKLLNKKRVRDYGKLFLIIAIFSLWFSQLQTVFVSLLAFAAAIVIAFKEVIMCMTGGMLIRLNNYFSSGDRIEIDGTRGFVVERTITSTKVLELGPERNSQQTTGNIVTIPNSVFLAKAVVNQSYFQNFSIRSFTLSPIPNLSFDKSESILLEIANQVCHNYLKKAKDSISNFCKKEGLLIPTIEPRVKLLLSDLNEAKLLLKMPVDNKKIGDIEQEVYRGYYKHVLENKEEVRN